MVIYLDHETVILGSDLGMTKYIFMMATFELTTNVWLVQLSVSICIIFDGIPVRDLTGALPLVLIFLLLSITIADEKFFDEPDELSTSQNFCRHTIYIYKELK